MAKPDLDDGWFMLAYELLPPLMMCCQRTEASVVLCEVLAQTYGRSKLKAAKLRPAVIAEKTGIQRPHIWRGIKELTDKGILVRLGDGTFRFEKDYEKWKSPEGSLVPAQLAAYFAKFPKHVKEFEPDSSVPYQGTISKKRNAKSVPQEGTEKVEADPATVPYQGTESVPQEGTESVPYQGTETPPPPIRELEKGRVVVGDEGGEPSTRPSDPVKQPASRRAKSSPLASERPYRPDPAELLRAKELIEAIDPHQYLGQKVEAVKTLYPLEWIVEAYVRAAGKADRIVYFANNTLLRWWEQGFMDEVEVFEPRAARPPVTDPYIPAARPAPRRETKTDRQKAILDNLDIA